jgi:hypothetical protein
MENVELINNIFRNTGDPGLNRIFLRFRSDATLLLRGEAYVSP